RGVAGGGPLGPRAGGLLLAVGGQGVHQLLLPHRVPPGDAPVAGHRLQVPSRERLKLVSGHALMTPVPCRPWGTLKRILGSRPWAVQGLPDVLSREFVEEQRTGRRPRGRGGQVRAGRQKAKALSALGLRSPSAAAPAAGSVRKSKTRPATVYRN